MTRIQDYIEDCWPSIYHTPVHGDFKILNAWSVHPNRIISRNQILFAIILGLTCRFYFNTGDQVCNLPRLIVPPIYSNNEQPRKIILIPQKGERKKNGNAWYFVGCI